MSEFIQLCYDLGDVDSWLHRFVMRLNELESTKPEDLLWLASQIFRSPELSLQNHYLEADSDTSVRHVEFTNLRAFLLTDFFEGLAHNHYPRRCPVCKGSFRCRFGVCVKNAVFYVSSHTFLGHILNDNLSNLWIIY